MLTCVSEGKILAKFCPVTTPNYKGLMCASRKEAFSDSLFSSGWCLEKNTCCICYNTFLLSLTQTVACIIFATCKANFCTILVQHDMHLSSIAIETASFQKKIMMYLVQRVSSRQVLNPEESSVQFGL